MEKFIKMIAAFFLMLSLAGCASTMRDIDYGPSASPSQTRLQDPRELVPSYGTESLDQADAGITDDPRDSEALAADSYESDARHIAFADAECAMQPGDIVIYTSKHKLLFVMSCGEGMLYSVAVGREGMQWAGATTVERTALWPDWYPPEEMRVREAAKGHDLPEMMPGGIDNPLGARAIYLAGTPYRIHGTNKPESIGTDASSGCIRMHNADVMALYSEVRVGAHVYVLDQNDQLPQQVAIVN